MVSVGRRAFARVAGVVCAAALSLGVAGAGLSLTAPAWAADGTAQTEEEETILFTDSAGREVEIPANITSVAPSGPLAQMVLLTFDPSILGGLSGEPSEAVEQYFGIDGDDYAYFGQIYGGKGNTANLEELAASGCQLIIDIGEAKSTIVEDLDDLQASTGIPCIHIETSIATYGDAYRTLGQILGNEERGEELGEYCDRAYADTQAVVETIADEDRANVAYVTDETHAIAYTSYQGQVVDNAANNVVVVEEVSGSSNEISVEQLAEWDPDLLFISDEDLYNSVADDPVWSTLSAVENGTYYLVPTTPYNWLNGPPSVNQLLGSLWFPRVCYPELFDDDLQDVVTEYYSIMYGYDLTDEEYEELIANSIPAELEEDAA